MLLLGESYAVAQSFHGFGGEKHRKSEEKAKFVFREMNFLVDKRKVKLKKGEVVTTGKLGDCPKFRHVLGVVK